MTKFLGGILVGLIVAAGIGYFFNKEVYEAGRSAGVEEAKLAFAAEVGRIVPSRTDTVTVIKEIERVRIIKTPKIDTVKILPWGDQEVATRSIDETLYSTVAGKKDSVKVGDLFAKYFFPPVDRFQVDFVPVPIKQQVIKEVVMVPVYKTVERPARWHEKPWPWITLGVVVGSIGVVAVQ